MIDQWVMREACSQLLLWQGSNDGVPLRAAVNLSARHFASPQMIDGIKNCLRDARILPSSLQLEIADPVAASNPDHTPWRYPIFDASASRVRSITSAAISRWPLSVAAPTTF
jgi:EAL domain-containing protein (putative c-di-GMP-specific phosphodiesterase class I)